jgi:RNA polymerase sigma factor (sigma-70 family)
LNYLHRQALQQGGGLADGELLDRFVRSRDEAAFELLVWRHGPLVVNVCRRLLRDEHDIDDAFQATFAALACKARSIRKQTSAAPWLYRVAYRSALAARARSNRHVSLLTDIEPLAAADESLLWRDLRPVLDAEVQKLAEKYRSVFVLCCLQGLTHGEAAARLGCPEGTIHSRLATARQQLRRGLERRGITIAGAGLVLELCSGQTTTPPTAQLIQQTLTTAISMTSGKAVKSSIITLTKGVIFTMWVQSYTAPLLVTLALGLVGVGVAGYQRSAGSPGSDEPAGRAAQNAASSRKAPALPQVQPREADKNNPDELREPTPGMDLDNTLLKLMMDEQTMSNKYGAEHIELVKLRQQIKFLNDMIARREASRRADQPGGDVGAPAAVPTRDQAQADLAAQLQTVWSELEETEQRVLNLHRDRRRHALAELYEREEALRLLEQQASFEQERAKKKLDALMAEELETEKSIRASTFGRGVDIHKQLIEVQKLISQSNEELRVRQAQHSKESLELRLRLDDAKQALQAEDEKWARDSAATESILGQMRANLVALKNTARFPQLAGILAPAAEDKRVGRLENKLDQVIRELAEMKKQLAKPAKD